MQPLYIFDLDGTTIDSSHRLGDGTVKDWRRLSTPASIARDTLLPLARTLLNLLSDAKDCVILTSRVMSSHDYNYHTANGFDAPVYSRDVGDDRLPGAYKYSQLARIAIERGCTLDQLAQSAVIYDDDWDVLDTLTRRGFTVLNATRYNHAITSILEFIK